MPVGVGSVVSCPAPFSVPSEALRAPAAVVPSRQGPEDHGGQAHGVFPGGPRGGGGRRLGQRDGHVGRWSGELLILAYGGTGIS